MSNENEESVVPPYTPIQSAELAATMAKIAAILKEDDCAALVILAKPGGGEVRVTLDATWSCAKISEDGTFTMKTSALPQETRAKTVYESANALNIISDLAARSAVELLTATEFVNDKFKLTHHETYHIPRTKPH